MSDRKKLMALRDASVDARRKAALGLDMGDPSSLETLNRTHILIMALDASSMNYTRCRRRGAGRLMCRPCSLFCWGSWAATSLSSPRRDIETGRERSQLDTRAAIQPALDVADEFDHLSHHLSRA
jgi:hypothetical protein